MVQTVVQYIIHSAAACYLLIVTLLLSVVILLQISVMLVEDSTQIKLL